MNSFVFLVFLICLIAALPMKLSKQVKEQAAKNAEAQKAAPKQASKSQKKQAPKPAPTPLYEEGTFLRPTVMQPTISITEHDDSVYTGSMNANTGEGYDPCHDEQLAPLTAAETSDPAVEAAGPGLQLSWTGSDIVNGIVMSEILKRKS
ncbi:MAG: hypothetical protein IKZ98_00640 [Clostridia bacterium]|nr:hypothetical protein [Clostridia bacterium]